MLAVDSTEKLRKRKMSRQFFRVHLQWLPTAPAAKVMILTRASMS